MRQKPAAGNRSSLTKTEEKINGRKTIQENDRNPHKKSHVYFFNETNDEMKDLDLQVSKACFKTLNLRYL